jgi:hypothetical protein
MATMQKIPSEKACGRCGVVKLIEKFGKDKTRKSGLSCICRTCNKALSQAWRMKNPDTVQRAKRRREFSEKLTDSYIRGILKHGHGAPATSAEIPVELVALKREQLLLKRLAKKLNQEITNQLEKINES